MNKVTICENTFEPSTWETFENVKDIPAFLVDRFGGVWPSTAHIYLDHVANNADITPYDEAGIERLTKVTGHFFVVVYPEGIETIILIVAIAVAAAAIGVSFLLRPSTATKPNYGSPNNALGDRENKARPNQRIPDIFGTLWATFDLISAPYKTFVANQEFEHCFMCIGRGSYTINQIAGLYQIRDDTTPLSEIDNATAQVYGPNNGPGGTPQVQVGPVITEPVVNLIPFTGVNGQILNAFNIQSTLGSNSPLKFINGGSVCQIQNSTGLNFSTYFNVGDQIVIGGRSMSAFMVYTDDIANDPSGIKASVHLGSYLGAQCVYSITAIDSISAAGDTLRIGTSAACAAINPGWSTVALYSGGSSAGASTFSALCNFIDNGSFFVGPFWLNYPTMIAIWANFVCPQSLYVVDNNGNQQLCQVTCEMFYWQADINGNPVGSMLSANVTWGGNRTDRLMKGATLKMTVTPGAGGILLCAMRTTASPNFGGGWQFQDQTQWRDCYIISGTAPSTYGNVTTIQTVIPNTPSALAVRDRKLNALVSRNLPTTSGPAAATVVDFAVVASQVNIYLSGTATGFQVGDTVFANIHYGILNLLAQFTITSITISGGDTIIFASTTIATTTLIAATGTVSFVSGIRGTNNAADIILAMATDPYIGDLQTSQVDVSGIYALAGPGGVIQSYFAMFPDLTLPTQFCYTFDDATVTFEESLTDICTAIFCVGYRRGGLLSLSFEQATPNSTLLFNHRNKVPKSETRTVAFGTLNAQDGIELTYTEPNAPNFPNLDTAYTLYFPPGASVPSTASGTNPKKVTAIGIRNSSQAMLLGWRLYWKLIAQNTTVQFEATEEATLSVLQDRILVADNTRADTQDGEVIVQTSLLLTLSQNVTFNSSWSYTIFLQHPDETVEAIPITAGANPNQVILGHAPNQSLVIGTGNYANTTYMIVSNAPTQQSAFLLAEKTPKDNRTFEIKAVNYDPLYYQHDLDFSTNIDAAALVVEAVVTPPASNADVAALVIEVVTT